MFQQCEDRIPQFVIVILKLKVGKIEKKMMVH